jgi:poly(3-hydroxybutyrate) depolymerase
MSSLVSIADNNGFIMIFPEATGENCWDAGSTRSLQHGGGGDTGAIVQMVKYALSKYNGDSSRVYSVGGSSGGIMTEALLGVYPDVFMAGVSLMGVPCGCWAQGYNDVTGNGNVAQWSGPCAGGNVTKTGQQWGDLVRSYFPGYTGHRPRLQHWHGTADTTLNFKNLAEDVKEWTNLLALSEAPTGTDTPASGTTHQSWKNACGYTVYETFSLAGVGHAVPFNGNAVAAYFGLNTAGGQDPETAACPGAVPGGVETGDAGAANGSGGAAGSGGADAGRGGRDAATPGAGGGQAGDSAGSGGASGSGGAGFGNADGGTGGSAGGTGGDIGTGGSRPQGGSGGVVSGATNGQGGTSAVGDSTAPRDAGSGCSITTRNQTTGSGSKPTGLLMITLALLLLRPRRANRTAARPGGVDLSSKRSRCEA